MASQGFSSRDPTKSRDTLAGIVARRKMQNNSRGRSSSGRSSVAPKSPSVVIRGNTVTIDGQGFSVAPSKQASFIQQKTGGIGSSAQIAIASANKVARDIKNKRIFERRKLEDQKKTNQLRNQLQRNYAKNQAGRFALEQRIKNIVQSERFEKDVKSGAIQGVSGIGLPPSQAARRDALVKLNIYKEESSKEKYWNTIDPLTTVVFVGNNLPTTQERANFNDHVRNKIQEFKVFKGDAVTWKDKLNFIRTSRIIAINLNNEVSKIRNNRGKYLSNQQKIKTQSLKQNFIRRLQSVGLIEVNWTKRQIYMAGLGFSSAILGFVGSIPATAKTVGTLAVVGITQAPVGIIKLVKDPKNTIKSGWVVSKSLGKMLVEDGKAFGKLLLIEPGLVVGKIAGEYVIMRGIGKSFKVIGKLTAKAAKKIIPIFKKIKVIKIPIKKVSSKIAKKAGLTGRSVKSIKVGTDDYKKVIDAVDDKIDLIAKKKSMTILKKIDDKGIKLGLGKREEFISAVRKYYRLQLKNLPDYQRLQLAAKLNKSDVIRLINQKKIINPKTLLNKINKRINNITIVKKIDNLLRRTTGVIRKNIKSVKGARESEIKKFRTAVEYKNKLNAAKKIRKAAGKRTKTITFGNSDYFEAIDKLYDFADDISRLRVTGFVKLAKSKGKKLSREEIKDLLRFAKKQAVETLEEFTDFKRLKAAAKYTKPWSVVLIKKGKLKTAKQFFIRLNKSLRNKIKTKILSYPGLERVIRLTKTGVRKVRRVSKKVSPKRIKKKIIEKRIRLRKIAEFKKTYKYQLYKKQTYRKVTMDKLIRTNSVNRMNNFVDELFDEMWKRRKVNTTALKFRQTKNILKKKLKRAINRGDKDEINRFKNYAKTIVRDLNTKTKNPTIKVSGKVGNKRVIRTIKDFETKLPKGGYQEVKVGDKILLQRVQSVKPKTVAATKTIQKQVLVVKAVQKKVIDLRPIIRYVTSAFAVPLVAAAIKAGFTTRPTQKQMLLLINKQGQKFAQDVKSVQALAQPLNINVATDLANNVASDVLSKTKQRFRTPQKTIQKTVTKKKIIPRIRMKKKKFRTLSKKAMAFRVIIKKKGKLVRVPSLPLLIKDAKDLAGWTVDRNLARIAKLVPVGMVSKVGILPKTVSGYYIRKGKKFRTFRVKKGKKFSLERTIIENKKYVGDTRSEQRQLVESKKKATKKKKR